MPLRDAAPPTPSSPAQPSSSGELFFTLPLVIHIKSTQVVVGQERMHVRYWRLRGSRDSVRGGDGSARA